VDRITIDYISTGTLDTYLFHQGNHYKSYNFLGPHLREYKGLKGVNFNIWAPNAKHVNVVGDFNNWVGFGYDMKPIGDSGIWNIFISGLREGEIYKYEIHTKNGSTILKSDPYAFYSELRPNTASIITCLEKYQWKDKEWQNKKNGDIYHGSMNIYELHLGSWKRKYDGDFLNYREIIDDILTYVVEMGYTHIEILPLMEHPFDGSWGYQTTGYFSVTSRYGCPEDFMYFVDRCHQSNVGVILDWVPGHFCKDDHGLYKFDGEAVYEYDTPEMAENIEWGTAVFDYSKGEVVSFLISNAIFWFDIYHIDGLRVDAVSYMLYLDYGKKDGDCVKNEYGGRENLEAMEFLKKLNKTVFNDFPHGLMIAEESTSWPGVTAPIHIDGLGFNFKWNMGWMNDMLRYVEMDPIYRKWHHNLITFSFTYAFTENYILPLSHDEVVHGKKSLIEKMPGGYWEKFANLRVLYSYMIGHPGKKLLFMGSEFAQFIEWNYQRELDWGILDFDMHHKIKSFVKELNHLYKREKSLYQLDSDYKGFSWIDHQNNEQSVIAFMRKGIGEDEFIIIICNFTPVARYDYKVGVPYGGEYEEVFNSDLEKFGGKGVINCDNIRSYNSNWHNQPHSIRIKIPPLGALFIKKKAKPLDYKLNAFNDPRE
jgi:1,4-alpha-glucan branching enzyme